MALVKVCPVYGCGERNPIDKPRCTKCGDASVSRVIPVEESELDTVVQDGMKKCPSCEEINPPGTRECKRCSRPLDDVAPLDDVEPKPSEERQLILKLANGHEIRVKDGDTIGRYDVAPDNRAVSRVHAKFTFKAEKWFIEDLSLSSPNGNGTYLNNVKIPLNMETEIKKGQKLAMSKSCEMSIQ